MTSEILLIDDEKDIRFAVHEILKENNFFVREADTVEKLDLNRVNSATGPIFVEGAMPGDSLAVTLKTIDPGPQGAGMVIPEWGQLIHKSKSPVTRIFKVSDGIVTMNEKVSFPAVPMLGVIGVAPESGAIATFEAGLKPRCTNLP